MTPNEIQHSSTTAGLPISPALGPTLENTGVLRHPAVLDQRTLYIAFLSIIVAGITTVIARGLVALIGLITNLTFYGRVSFELTSPANNHLGYLVILIPIIGGLIVGMMARYGSKAIRGHGIPEAMEQILTNESRIPLRMTFLKPLSAAIVIGTGGPFGAEGPIIATGGALGSYIGQIIHVSAQERKTILAAGAAAGMTAIFGTPLSAILLAIELLVFEFRPRSFIPVSVATLVAICLRPLLFGDAPLFHVPAFPAADHGELLVYTLIGALAGIGAVVLSKSIYFIEDMFEKLPMHWMWWPAIGGCVVGVIGYYAPLTLGIGYQNIEQMLNGNFVGITLLVFCILKFLSWSIALGSGTSGGTLAPLFTLGGGLGVLSAQVVSKIIPGLAVDLRMAALVGMASCFAGASRAMFASIAFALEITQQYNALLPLLAGCTAAFIVSALLMKNTIMTEKLSRRGHHVPSEYTARH
jgi:H+/Cl- antiporter ClcA